MIRMKSKVGEHQFFSSLMVAITKPLDRTAEELFRISVKSWKGKIKVGGKRRVVSPPLGKRDGNIEQIFFYYPDFRPSLTMYQLPR